MRIGIKIKTKLITDKYGTAQSKLDTRTHQIRVRFSNVLSKARMLLEC